ncbi:hypothetical protein [Ferruginivarius sediminum]|uniref:hypothetical protein n=1 Tax=Ferruginivarius sediminum TaxID=2661937 RepID=UPI0012935DFA|nr:hypothetical protein [Ferruginivarius sediminum]
MATAPYRDDITCQQAEERHDAFAALLRAACAAVNEQGRGNSLRSLEAAVRRVTAAYGE